jgi:probable F420-dependent oxidoreductase
VEFGVGYFPTHDGMHPAELAKLVEERGQESLFFTEHTHIPASRESPWGGGPVLPQKYWHCYDLFVAAAAAITVTSRLRVGSGVCLVVERDPIIAAKEVASVDHLSGGRFEFGIGSGWNKEEMRNHGTDPRTRLELMRERVEAMKAIWTSDEASYEGRFVNFDRIWQYPKPAQRPHPPILVGGEGPTVLDRVRQYGTAWFPNYDNTDALLERILAAAGVVEVQVCGAPARSEILLRMRDAGVTRVVRWLPSGPRGPIEKALDRWEQSIVEVTNR